MLSIILKDKDNAPNATERTLVENKENALLTRFIIFIPFTSSFLLIKFVLGVRTGHLDYLTSHN